MVAEASLFKLRRRASKTECRRLRMVARSRRRASMGRLVARRRACLAEIPITSAIWAKLTSNSTSRFTAIRRYRRRFESRICSDLAEEF